MSSNKPQVPKELTGVILGMAPNFQGEEIPTIYHKNEELERMFKDLSRPVVACVFDTRNPDIKQMLVIQKKINIDVDRKMNDRFLGWSNGRLVRCFRSVKLEKLIKANIGIGTDFHDGEIEVIEDVVPSYEGQSPKRNPQTGQVIFDDNGCAIYEHAYLVKGASQDVRLARARVLHNESLPLLENNPPVPQALIKKNEQCVPSVVDTPQLGLDFSKIELPKLDLNAF